ncbi:MAG: tetratricopeptide repeat protein [Saprospiraceae bacterium]|nr:tetratricopeptide repeat protein [Saprospiraceae bacterium]
MEDVHKYLNDDGSPVDPESVQQVMEGLAMLRIEEKVAAVAAQRAALRRKRILRGLLLGALLAALVAAIWLVFTQSASDTPAPASSPSPVQPPAAPPDVTPSPAPPASKPRQPIAQAPASRLPDPRYPAPATQLRSLSGSAEDAKALKILLDQLWYTDYPIPGLQPTGAFAETDQLLSRREFTTAYARLDRLERKLPDNDTLRYLKGYCLLELGQGAEALAYLESLQGRVAAWDAPLDWYQALGLLQSGQQDKARAAFRRIAAQNGHPFQAYGKKGVELLK